MHHHESHEWKQIKSKKCIGLILDENVFWSLFMVLWTFLGSIRVIRGLVHDLSSLRTHQIPHSFFSAPVEHAKSGE